MHTHTTAFSWVRLPLSLNTRASFVYSMQESSIMMDGYLEMIRSRSADPHNTVPERIRGEGLSPRFSQHYCRTYSPNPPFIFHAGSFVNSCTATVAALAHWLTGMTGKAETVEELLQYEGHPFSELGAVLAERMLPSAPDALVVFSMPMHKFALLIVCGEAVLLHSNQFGEAESGDRSRAARTFTLHEYLAVKPKRMDAEEVNAFVSSLQRALVDADDHMDICGKLFDVRFKRGHRDEYKFRVVEIP
jgi:hypothetical protein